MTEDKAKILFERRHQKLKDKADIWKLIHQSYKGGVDYINKDNLFQYTIEDNKRYTQRLKRADYTNHTQMLINMIAGFINVKKVKRDIDPKYSYIENDVYKGKTLQSLMDMVVVECLKSTCGLLIDSPSTIDGLTEADRIANNLHPFVVFYNYTRIEDFDIDDNGELLWIKLNNSYIDKSDPYSSPVEKKIVRLWTRTYYQDIEEVKDENSNTTYIAYEEIPHSIGKVPFIFTNPRDIDDDFIADSIFEDIAIKSRKIFNMSSWLDESLAASSFKMMFVPYENADDLAAITQIFTGVGGSGLADSPAVFFKQGTQKPFFDGPAISDNIDNYIKSMALAAEDILNKFGLKSESKGSWESGVAKSIDFSKTEAILKSISKQLEETEKKIIYFCGLWEGKEIKAEIAYSYEYEKQDIEKELLRLQTAFIIPYDEVQKQAYKEMLSLIFPNADAKTIKALEAAIDKPTVSKPFREKINGEKTPENNEQSEDFKEVIE